MLFVNEGTTSVGIYVVQFAKLFGYKVQAGASGKNEGLLKGLSVDNVRILYH